MSIIGFGVDVAEADRFTASLEGSRPVRRAAPWAGTGRNRPGARRRATGHDGRRARCGDIQGAAPVPIGAEHACRTVEDGEAGKPRPASVGLAGPGPTRRARGPRACAG